MTFMRRVRVFHWKANEAVALLETLRSSGYQVDYNEKHVPGLARRLKASPPDAFVIDLSRLPSHGREVATFVRGSSSTRRVPIVFVDGAPEKVEAIRLRLPDAVYTSSARLRSALRQAIANVPASPVVPAQMMERYASRAASQKLGIREGAAVAVIDPPRGYVSAIGKLPDGVSFQEDPGERCPVTLWFVDNAEAYRATLPRMRKVAGHTKLWILWRKQSARASSGITPQFLRETAGALGLVDYKICSVNETWSAMLFARKKGAV